jgi:hypothetical protein
MQTKVRRRKVGRRRKGERRRNIGTRVERDEE